MGEINLKKALHLYGEGQGTNLRSQIKDICKALDMDCPEKLPLSPSGYRKLKRMTVVRLNTLFIRWLVTNNHIKVGMVRELSSGIAKLKRIGKHNLSWQLSFGRSFGGSDTLYEFCDLWKYLPQAFDTSVVTKDLQEVQAKIQGSSTHFIND